ncbi:MAG: hypothetical protein ACXWLB_01595 [Reyranella sp.]
MSGSTFFAGANSTAQAMGNLTVTNTATATLAAPGVAIGYAAAVAEAQNTAPTAPHTSVTTDSIAVGGTTTSAHTAQWSVDFLAGPTPVSVDVSVTSVSTHGGSDFLSDYGLAGPSVHGLF